MTEYTINWPAVVAAVSAIIAFGALWVTFNKYRMDLYDRRFAIYTATLDLYQALFAKSNPDLEELSKPFIKGCRQSQYLFDDRSGIYEALEAFRTEYSKVKAARDEGERPAGERNQEILNLALRSPPILEESLKKLEGLLMPYLTYKMLDFNFWRYFGKPRAKFDR